MPVALCLALMPLIVSSQNGLVLMQLSSRMKAMPAAQKPKSPKFVPNPNPKPAPGRRNYKPSLGGGEAEFHLYNESLRGKAMVWRAATATEQQGFVDAHNKYRCMHGAPAVTWSSDMADSASEYIDPLTELEHSDSYSIAPPAGPAGENLAMGYAALTPEEAVKMWYEESEDCVGGAKNFNDGCNPGANGAITGHFTAMIWTGVKQIGCAFSASTSPTLVICRYKSGDTLDDDTPNMGTSDNYVPHVLAKTKTEDECDSAGTGVVTG